MRLLLTAAVLSSCSVPAPPGGTPLVDAADPLAPEKMRVPGLMLVVPLYVLALVRVTADEPCLPMPPVPLMTPANVAPVPSPKASVAAPNWTWAVVLALTRRAIV